MLAPCHTLAISGLSSFAALNSDSSFNEAPRLLQILSRALSCVDSSGFAALQVQNFWKRMVVVHVVKPRLRFGTPKRTTILIHSGRKALI